MSEDNKFQNWLKSNSLRALIFDFDGTLLDISEPLERALKETFEEYKLDVDFSQTKKEIGSVLESVQGYPLPKIILESHDIFKFIPTLSHLTYFKKLRIATKIFTRYLEYEKDAPLLSGAKDLLKELNNKYDLYVVSHNQSKNLKHHREEKKLGEYFEAIYGADDLPALKPNPVALQPVLSQYSPLNSNEFVMIGDMPTDVEVAQEAGIWSIAIASGISNKELLIDYRPDVIVESLYELMDIFGIKYEKDTESKAQESLEVKT
ncbi:MAG: Pyrophosphatase PpaX [Promethearchaeota archaeon]|jgi:HAD superfamily hydrolase (TIGR01549 family)|nr:MAG: Pyrophosphatase PpaX [Candidatus Lokiarchaeota archaeon]